MTMKLIHLTMLAMTISFISACGGEQSVPTTTTATVKLPHTGQTLCYDAVGTVVSCALTGQDGELLKGVAWAEKRFADQSNGTMLDNNTGLIWTKGANAPGPTVCTPTAVTLSWQGALDYVKCLNSNGYLGFTDWRLPNILELRSLVNTAQPDTSLWLITQGFSGVQPEAWYWSSTSAADGPSSAWGVGMVVGDVDGNDKSDRGYVWSVRSGQSGLFDSLLPRSGQTRCYDTTGAITACADTGQDGDTLKGAVWPLIRFTDLANGTMWDNLTGLIWTNDGNAPGPALCIPATTKNWQAAHDYVKCLNSNNYLGFSDWRLPNQNELSSLVDHAHLNQATWLTGNGFTGVQAVFYWSSSTSAASPSDAWGVDMGDGDIDGDSKYYSQYVWPVRSGI